MLESKSKKCVACFRLLLNCILNQPIAQTHVTKPDDSNNYKSFINVQNAQSTADGVIESQWKTME